MLPYLLPLSFPYFGGGMLLALAYVVGLRWGIPGRVPPAPLYIAAAILTLFAATGWGGGAVSEWSGLLWPMALVATVAFGAGRSLFRAPLMHWLGLVSYGIYLYHDPLIEKIGASGWWLGPSQLFLPINALAAICVTLIFASLSFYVVERPILRLKPRRESLSPRE